MQNRKVNVLFLLNSLTFGGGEKHVVSLLNGLSTEKFNLSLGYLKDKTTLLPQLNQQRLTLLFHAGVRSKIDFRAARTIAKYIDELDIDVIVCTNEYPLIFSYLARKFSIKQPAMMEVFHSTIMQTLKDKLRLKILKPLFKIQHKLVYVCQAQKDLWEKQGLKGQQNLVIYNGIDTDYFHDNWSDEDKLAIRRKYGFNEKDYVIGICAALRPEKAHRDLIQAIAALRKKGVLAHCLIIGEGAEREKIERQIKDLTLEQDIRISGFMEDVRPLISVCDVMTLVSHGETFSISALESMSLGKPMLMSDIGGAKEQVSDDINGYLFPVGDILRLTEALEKLSDPEKCRQFGQISRKQVVSHFSEKLMLEQFEDELSDLGVKHT